MEVEVNGNIYIVAIAIYRMEGKVLFLVWNFFRPALGLNMPMFGSTKGGRDPAPGFRDLGGRHSAEILRGTKRPDPITNLNDLLEPLQVAKCLAFLQNFQLTDFLPLQVPVLTQIVFPRHTERIGRGRPYWTVPEYILNHTRFIPRDPCPNSRYFGRVPGTNTYEVQDLCSRIDLFRWASAIKPWKCILQLDILFPQNTKIFNGCHIRVLLFMSIANFRRLQE